MNRLLNRLYCQLINAGDSVEELILNNSPAIRLFVKQNNLEEVSSEFSDVLQMAMSKIEIDDINTILPILDRSPKLFDSVIDGNDLDVLKGTHIILGPVEVDVDLTDTPV